MRQGKALYAGVSGYNAEQSRQAFRILKRLEQHHALSINHYSIYSLVGLRVIFSLPQRRRVLAVFHILHLPQGLLTDRYLNKFCSSGSRAAKPHGYLREDALTTRKAGDSSHSLNEIASSRGQTLATMCLAWVCQHRLWTCSHWC